MKGFKRIISLLLVLILTFAFSVTSFAASPQVGNTMYVNTNIDAKNSATGAVYKTDTGSALEFLRLREYDQNPVYCIEKGAKFTRTLYKAQTLSGSAYWNSLSAAAREGIALAAAFGYPAQQPSALGVPSADDAYTATQYIIWEYQQGLRTAPDEQIADNRYRAKIAGTPAETAYKTILANIRKYTSNSQYDGYTQDIAGFVQLTSGSASQEQEIICFYGTTPQVIEKGNIEIYKKDTNGSSLDGAEFTVYDRNGNYVTTIGPTVNGYAKSSDISLGSYTVVETKFPTNYRAYGKSSWNVTVGAENLKVTITAVNEIIPGSCQIVKVSEDNSVKDISFRITGNGIDKTASTNSEGKITFSDLKPGRYTVYENTADKYVPQESKVVTVVSGETAVVTFSNVLKRGKLEITKTSEDGLISGLTFRLTGNSLSGLAVDEYAVTNENGIAVFNDVLIGSGYVLQEMNTPDRYVVPESQTVSVEWNNVTKTAVNNVLKKWRADVCKFDSELKQQGNCQGNATLEGAVYGVYKGSQLVDTYTTDKNGGFVTEYYVCGDDWTFKEIQPSAGYTLDETAYKVNCLPGNYKIEKNTEYINVFERVIKGRIAIIKHSDDGSTQIETPEKNAVFEIYLKSSGSYNKANKNERDVITTDKYGFSETKLLPYGVYICKQIKGPDGKELMPEFEVNIRTDGEIYRYIINNATFKADIIIQKADAETGKIIPAAGVGFKVRNKDTGEFVVQHINYPEQMDIEVYYTTADGSLMMLYALPFGNYEIIEQCTAYGYVLDGTPVPFKVDGSVSVVTVTKSNKPQKGVINITKTGEVFYSVTEKDGMYRPVYKEAGLEGAVFGVYADEDICTPDGTLRYAKGQRVDTLTTGADGRAKTKELYLGKYLISEEKAPYGTVLNKENIYAELVYAGENVSVTSDFVSLTNDRQKLVLDLFKTMEQDETFKLGMNGEISNVRFGLYASEVITALDGTQIPKDGLLEIVTCNKDGKAIFSTDIPVGSKLYVKEYATDDSYILSDTVYDVEFIYAGQDVAAVAISVNDGNSIDNKIIRGNIEGLKKDENGNALKDAVFGLFRADTTEFTKDTAILTTVSDENGVFGFCNVPVGVWLIKELSCPEQFVLSDKVFTTQITENGQIIEIKAVNKYITGNIKIIKSDADSAERLSGVEFGLYDADGNELAKGVTDDNGELIFNNLRFGKYEVRELSAKDGYYKVEDTFSAEITENGQVIVLEVDNEKIPPVPTPESPKTGDNSNAGLWLTLLIVSLLALAGLCIYNRKARN